VAGEREILKRIGTFGMHYQLAWYWDGIEAAQFVIVRAKLLVVQTQAPYSIWVGQIDQDDITDARNELQRIRAEVAARFASGNWQDDGTHRLRYWRVPDWAKPPIQINIKGQPLTL
jgi:hypothetical protein